MGMLPIERLQPAPAFYYCAVDLFGPFMIRDTVKKRTHGKAYGVLFNCLTTRAVYVDLAEGYDTSSFIMTLRRFVTVRGYPRKMISDSGSQLVAAGKELQQVVHKWDWEPIKSFGECKGMDWVTTKSADAPWENGVSESLVKSVKKSLEVAIGTSSYMTKDRSVSKDTSTNLQQDEQLQDAYENDGVNPDHLIPFTGTSEEFSKLLSTGTYESFENRVFLCGSCACGKSTLASVLIGSTIPLTWKSTDGLVIHFGRNGINLETFDMVPLLGEDRCQNVLTKVVIGKPTRETSTCQSSDTHHDKPLAPSPMGTDSLESNLKAIQKKTVTVAKSLNHQMLV
ncbi:unnamed protein product [Mytilus edulis]|uniref:Integrase catalytic domain-containing protein n=1 Tax=Mytilus edulis TaxID=6550 RepID=A0A8S3UU16_MYTED|nr:unnamed protein product [Mytilus edulis]